MTKSRWRIEWEQGLMTLDERATDPAADDTTKAVHMLALFALRTHAPWLSHCIDCTTNREVIDWPCVEAQYALTVAGGAS